jgi:hypothetical protein
MTPDETIEKPSRRKYVCEIFQTDRGTLFVPTEQGWCFHEQSKPSAVAKRAGLSERIWSHEWWRLYGVSHPWLFEWLYHRLESLPAGFPKGAIPTEGMHAFRKESTGTAILKAVVDVARSAGHSERWTSTGPIYNWIAKFRQQHPWVEGWFLRGEEPPPNVVIATVEQIRYYRRLWDFKAHCQKAGLSSSNNSYCNWIDDGVIPDLQRLEWLYGEDPPPEVFVVYQSLQQLRKERTQEAICAATPVTHKALINWKSDPRFNRAFEAIMAGKHSSPRSESEPDPRDTVSPETRGKMEAYARAATLEASCERAGFPLSNLHSYYLKEAEKRGVRGELERYLGIESPIPEGPFRRRAVAKQFFIPTPGMFAFRAVAAKVKADDPLRNKSLKGRPGYDEWLNSWTVTARRNGERRSLPRCSGSQGLSATPGPHNDTQLENNPKRVCDTMTKPERRGRKRGSIDKEVEARNSRIKADWLAGKYKSIRALADAHEVSRPTASEVVNH